MVRSPAALDSSSQGNHRDLQGQTEIRFEGFDFLRAIFSIAIVALKTELFLLLEILVSGALVYAFVAKFAYLAVPVFLQISLFLLYLKAEKTGFRYFLQKRLPRLVFLYVFWVGAKLLFDMLFNKNFLVMEIFSSPRRLIEFIVSGGQSPFFFFFSLIFLSTIGAALWVFLRRFERHSTRLLINYFLLFVSCFLVFSLSISEIAVRMVIDSSPPGWVRSMSSLAFWDYNPICFLPYLFTAAISVQEFNREPLRDCPFWLKLKLFILLFLTVFFFVLEWHLFDELLHYSRLSLVFGSWLLLYLALLSTFKASPVIKFLASCSLGIYGFHVFFDYIFSGGDDSLLRNHFQIPPGFDLLIGFILVLFSSIAMTLLFKRIKWFKQYV